MLDLPNYIPFVFICTTLVAYLLLIFAVFRGNERTRKRTHVALLLLLTWIIFQSTLALNRWYMDRKAMPPHVAFPIVFSVVAIALLFFTPRGRRFIDGLSLEVLTWLHTVRVPVELCLWWLAMQKQLPWSMTFEGRNFDVVFGLTAPIIAYFGIRRQRFSPKIVLAWNVLGLLSVMQVVITGIGAVPSPIQWWEFRQPNYAVIHFPFIWLPAFIVPAVVLAHLIAIRRYRTKAINPENASAPAV